MTVLEEVKCGSSQVMNMSQINDNTQSCQLSHRNMQAYFIQCTKRLNGWCWGEMQKKIGMDIVPQRQWFGMLTIFSSYGMISAVV